VPRVALGSHSGWRQAGRRNRRSCSAPRCCFFFAALHAVSGWRTLLALAGSVLVALVALDYGADWQRANDLGALDAAVTDGTVSGAFVTPQARYLHGWAHGQFICISGAGVVETCPNDDRRRSALRFCSDRKRLHAGCCWLGQTVLRLYAVCCWCRRSSASFGCHPDPAYPPHALAALPAELRPDPARFVVPREDCALLSAARSTETFDAALLNLPDATTLVANRCLTPRSFSNC